MTRKAKKGKKGKGEGAMGWLAVAALALIVLAGCCATADVALLRVSRAGAKELGRRTAAEGSSPLQAVLAEVPRYLSVLSLARVAGEAGATVLLTVVLLHVIGPGWRAFAITAAIMIAAIYVATGLVPRAAERRNPARVALAAAAVLHPVVRFLGPLPRFLGATGRKLGPGRGASGSEADLRGLVDLLEQRQVIEPGERAMIHSVFELGDTIVREVMVPRTDMVFVERDKTLGRALSLALRSGFSRVPVIGENLDDVVGIAYLKDIVARSQLHRECESVEQVSSIMRPATFVPESKPVDELLKEMQARQIHLAIVIDEYGGTAGLVTMEDLLEEIVGEIRDEHDEGEEEPIRQLAPDEWVIEAGTNIEDVNNALGISLPHEEFETIGGYVVGLFGRLPREGEEVDADNGIRLRVDRTRGRRILTVRVLTHQSDEVPQPETASTRPA